MLGAVELIVSFALHVCSGKHNEVDPAVLICTECDRTFGCRERLYMLFGDLYRQRGWGEPPFPTEIGADKFAWERNDTRLTLLKWQHRTLESCKSPDDVARYWTEVAAIQLYVQFHRPMHHDSCYKRGEPTCRYKTPHKPSSAAALELTYTPGDVRTRTLESLSISELRRATCVYHSSNTWPIIICRCILVCI